MPMCNSAEKWLRGGVVLCILSPAVLISLSGVSAAGFVSEALFVNIGMLVLLTMVAVAVMIFIRSGITIGRYKYIRACVYSALFL